MPAVAKNSVARKPKVKNDNIKSLKKTQKKGKKGSFIKVNKANGSLEDVAAGLHPEVLEKKQPLLSQVIHNTYYNYKHD